MTTTHFPAPRSAAAVAATRTRTALDDLGDAAQSFVATLRVWRRRLHERDQLSRMDDRLLKDIGITRAEKRLYVSRANVRSASLCSFKKRKFLNFHCRVVSVAWLLGAVVNKPTLSVG